MKVNICGIPYQVEEATDLFNSEGIHFGQIDYLNAKILINKDATPEIKKETLCHEIIHAIFANIGKQELSMDEELVQALGNAINQTFDVRVTE